MCSLEPSLVTSQYEIHSCKGDTLFPSKGFFNEVTRIKEKRFKKTMSLLFPPTLYKSKD